MITKKQRKALDELVYAHDEMDQAIADLYDCSDSDNIGWNQSAEIQAHVIFLRERWERMARMFSHLHELREPPDSAA